MKKHKTNEGIRYLNPKYLSSEIGRLGYVFSVRKYISYFLGLYGCIAVISYIFKLKWQCILIISMVAACFIPGIFMMLYRNMYEEKKFEDITAYMEQVLYSFKRRAKILTSLEDALSLFSQGESRLYDAVSEAIGYIQNAQAGESIYKEAFAIIEREYGCTRLYKIHDFLIEAEAVGGDFTQSADMLLDDRRMWIDRVYELQRDKKNVMVKITIGIGLSFLICGMTVFMLPAEFGITEHVISQAAATITVLLNMLIWYAAWHRLSKSLIRGEEGMEYEEVKRQYDYVMHRDLKKELKKLYPVVFVLVLGAGVLLLNRSFTAAVFCVIFAGLVSTQPKRRYRISLKHMARAVEKAFPEWLMSMSLQLQTDNVHVSLAKSIPRAPKILEEELTRLMRGIEKEPDSVKPYLSFMDKAALPDITSAMKVLYSMAEYGAADIGRQIGPLVERNAVMTDKAERLKAEDYIAGTGFLVLLPMITGVIKMLADLALVVIYILSAVGNMA